MKTRCKPGDIATPIPQGGLGVHLLPTPVQNGYTDEVMGYIRSMVATLPHDVLLNMRVLAKIEAVISDARNGAAQPRKSKPVSYLRLVQRHEPQAVTVRTTRFR